MFRKCNTRRYTKRITVSVDEETLAIIEDLSKRLGVTYSGVVRMAVRVLSEKIGG